MDIDYFKAVNDSFGHLFGDMVLQEISRLFLDLFDKKDILVRAGGDEFVIFLKDISHGMLLKKAEQLVNSVRSLKFAETGSLTSNDYQHIKNMIEQFREKQFRTAMDDFGAGYSMLNMLIDIPVDTIKVDRAFVHHCESNDRGVTFLKQLVEMAKGLGYHLVCEGIIRQDIFP